MSLPELYGLRMTAYGLGESISGASQKPEPGFNIEYKSIHGRSGSLPKLLSATTPSRHRISSLRDAAATGATMMARITRRRRSLVPIRIISRDSSLPVRKNDHRVATGGLGKCLAVVASPNPKSMNAWHTAAVSDPIPVAAATAIYYGRTLK